MILRRPRRPGLIPTVNLAVGERPSGSARRFPAGGGSRWCGRSVRFASLVGLRGLARADGFPFAAVLLPIGLSGYRVTKRFRVPRSGVRPFPDPGGPLRVGRGAVDRFVYEILARFRCLGEGPSGPAAGSGPFGPGGAVASGVWGRESASSAHGRRDFGASKGVMTDDTARADSPMGAPTRMTLPQTALFCLEGERERPPGPRAAFRRAFEADRRMPLRAGAPRDAAASRAGAATPPAQDRAAPLRTRRCPRCAGAG